MTGKLLIAIPMKDPKQAKTRLSEALPPQERQRFALSLFLRTLDQIAAAQCEASVVVVTADTASSFFNRLAAATLIFWQSSGDTSLDLPAPTKMTRRAAKPGVTSKKVLATSVEMSLAAMPASIMPSRAALSSLAVPVSSPSVRVTIKHGVLMLKGFSLFDLKSIGIPVG